MRGKKLPILAVVALAAGLSLTACGPDDPSPAGASSPSGAAAGSGGSGGSGPHDSMCLTKNLGMLTQAGVDEGELVVNLENTGTKPCTIQGYPGVELKNADATLRARPKSDKPGRLTTLKPGEQTTFSLYYPLNQSGDPGTDYGRLVVTPPHETHSKTIDGIDGGPLNLTDDPDARPLTVDPVGGYQM
jgi:hypothetical protein